ncbi:MAG: hypothetical protein NPINA01_28790 [Nitrospinaceae bacterium]|nr:MAG: hypothetical protein NPINA01_28790 [Nitrospinaceae bacterium]
MEDTQASPEKKEEAAPAKPAGEKPKPKPKAAAKPKAKEKPPAKPLVDNGDGTVTDPNSGLMWKKSDAWLDEHRFYTWMDHREYVDKNNKEKFAGYDNWRIPSKAEALTIFDKTKECMDKNGTLFPLDPIFEAGGASNTWITECSDEKIIRFDGKIGIDTPYPTQEVWSSMRLVRKDGEAPPAPVGKEPDPAEAKAASVPAETAEPEAAKASAESAAPKPAAAKAPSGGGVPGPTPKKNRSAAEKAAMLARAKAHAAEVRARKAKG